MVALQVFFLYLYFDNISLLNYYWISLLKIVKKRPGELLYTSDYRIM